MTGTLLFIVGPPAVGKMTVGEAVAARTGLRVFHNHMTIEPVLRFFRFDSPAFGRLVGDFRRNLIAEVAASDLPGMIFTFVWAFDHEEDAATIEGYAELFRSRGGRVLYLELQADQAERLRRNEGASRLAAKPSKRDLEWSRANLLEMDADYQLDSGDRFAGRDDYLRLDTTHLSPDEVAATVIAHFGLAVLPEPAATPA
ncbi:hypothetical protein GCM10010168_28480 [Actinoplanes ianthinogenes]|uniref:Shikimate kinase n=1 Tax=Actinoplanes ianthinogenes TaxID=122358 RepID=A0ABN6C3A2_9ACTN|nr:AAA family ATPase [Actinoplanes ianthinogenes]BCJ39990.1 hypothetical protein Aiant_06470 [Actinoplanes ianthinogenes]GGR09503.1 hypothetical protein GCM10010168_28480 [Actinoplanes ianthinogenes]